jgi:hypothetical protein
VEFDPLTEVADLGLQVEPLVQALVLISNKETHIEVDPPQKQIVLSMVLRHNKGKTPDIAGYNTNGKAKVDENGEDNCQH